MRRWTTLLLTLVACGLAIAAKPGKPKIGGNGPIDRPTNHTGAWCFNEWTFCGAAPDSFVADGDSATVVFRVAKYFSGNQTTELDFHLDNVVVVTRAVYDANLGSLAGVPGYNCISSYVALDFAPLLPGGVVYHTNFDGAIGPEWSYDPVEVTYATDGTGGNAPMYDDPFNPSPSTTGSMDIGADPGSGANDVEVTLQLTGLVQGTEYVLTYWSASRDDDVGSPGCPQPPEEQDDYEVTIYGDSTICVPDLPAITASEIRTLAWDPVTEIWTFQVKYLNAGVGPGFDIQASLSSVPPTVTILENRVPIGYLGTEPRDDEAWAQDTFTLDMSGHTDPFAVVNFNYLFTDDCGEQSVVTSLTILADPTVYPTGTPEANDAAWLDQNYPNPFNPSTVLPVNLPQAGLAELAIYDLQGRRVRLLHEGRLPAGTTNLRWDGRDNVGNLVGAGTYLARLRVGERTQVRRMVLLK